MSITPSAAGRPSSRTSCAVELFEPAMCCESGVCGPSVDDRLLAVRDDLRWAQAEGAHVSRHNLSSDPDAFVANAKVTGLMAAFGADALPALVIDGEIVLHGRYPSRQELSDALARPTTPCSSSSGGSGCGPSGCW